MTPGRSRAVLALIFVGAGVLHLTQTDAYVRVMPAYLPRPRELVWISGVAELAGGAGLLLPRTRRWAGAGLAALLVAVFPANVNMALHPASAGLGIAPFLLWLRLPLQALLVGWVWWAAIRRR